MATPNQLKQLFSRGAKPTQEHFSELIDSMYNKHESIPINAIEGLSSRLDDTPSAISPAALSGCIRCLNKPLYYHSEDDTMPSPYILDSDCNVYDDLLEINDIMGVDNDLSFAALYAHSSLQEHHLALSGREPIFTGENMTEVMMSNPQVSLLCMTQFTPQGVVSWSFTGVVYFSTLTNEYRLRLISVNKTLIPLPSFVTI